MMILRMPLFPHIDADAATSIGMSAISKQGPQLQPVRSIEKAA